MKLILLHLSIFFFSLTGFSQIINTYDISFSNARNHEVKVKAKFSNLESGPVTLNMSKFVPQSTSSYLFPKNILNLRVTDGKGDKLKVIQNNLSEWEIANHNGTINIEYMLFARNGDGIHSAINEKLSLLNPHSIFLYIDKLKSRPVEVKLTNFENYGWNISTQLKKKRNNLYRASDLEDLLDSPILLSNHEVKEFRIDVYGTEYTFDLAFADMNGYQSGLFDYLSNNLTKIIDQQKLIFGNYPYFDDYKYTFMIAVGPELSNDAKPHKNSSVITSNSRKDINKQVAASLINNFLAAWNSKRLTPATLEPFNYNKINMSEELWFSEGFNSYYTDLVLLRSGLISVQEYLDKIASRYNDVWVSSILESKNILELSSQSALHYNSEVNKNLYVPYDSYGYVIALALDLSLRHEDENFSLDNFMKLFWTKYGKTKTPYNIDNIFATLREYTDSSSFANNFFEKFIFESNQPEYDKILSSAGIELSNKSTPYTGIDLMFTKQQLAVISNYPVKNSPAYYANLQKGDVILSIDNETFSDKSQFDLVLSTYRSGKKVNIAFTHFGENKSTTLGLSDNPKIELAIDGRASKKAVYVRDSWLNEK